MSGRLTEYQNKKAYYESLTTSIRRLQKGGLQLSKEDQNRIDNLIKEREEVAKFLNEYEKDLLLRCAKLPDIDKSIVVDKFITGISNKDLANKYYMSYGSMRNKISTILKKIGLKDD